ncbi:hypothetical protein JNB91_28240 [Rhizobium wenxiniae]|uniref:hypothetical protein n=1 Tax=Rhizobium wenxiniae TaxID=1737357 RepID=UPI001C6F2A0C|nr:hypothetical protein [Rhizobium wenxiniae]MBW9091686.1 hypothetical protein [Rhizobium wenxiniae]
MNRRHVLLLLALSLRVYRALPKGVGMKTVIEAEAAGWIVKSGDFRADRIRCKLTPAGQRVARELSHGLRTPVELPRGRDYA